MKNIFYNKYTTTKKVLIALTFFFTLIMFIVFQLAFLNNTKNVIESWLDSESNNLKQGNLLPVMTKAERLISKSSLLDGFIIIEKLETPFSSDSETKILMEVGKKFAVNSDLNQKISFKNGISYYFKYSLPLNKVIIFKTKFSFWGNLIITISLIISIYLSIMYYLIYTESNRRFLIFKNSLESISSNNKTIEFLSDEAPYFIKAWNEANLKIEQQAEALKVAAYTQSQIDLATQLAHDIRSPLSALNLVTNSLKNIPEEHSFIIKNSIQRINQIALDLLKKSDQKNTSDEVTNHINSPIEINKIIENLVYEKNIEYKEKKNIIIKPEFSKKNIFLSQVKPSDISRILSNFVNNSVEAIEDKSGLIEVGLKFDNSSLIIYVKDNGPGIQEKVLNKLGKEKVSLGKNLSQQHSGSGIAVLNARKLIEQSGGELVFFSSHDSGTEFQLKFSLNLVS